MGVGGGSGGGARGVGDSAGAAGNGMAQWRSRRGWSMELHAQAAAGTLRAVVAPEAPLRAALLRRGAAGRCGSPGEAARPWWRLRPREGGGSGAEARARGRAAAAQLSAPARALHPGAAVQRPRGREGGLVCRLWPTAALPPSPLPSPAEPPSAALSTPLADPTPGPAAASCRSAGRPPAPPAADIRTVLWAVADTARALALELQSGLKYYQQKGIKACLHNTYS